MLFSTAITSIFIGALDSTDRINLSNQQLYSAVKSTRRVALYVKTHYNIASKSAFPTGVPDK